MSWNQQLTLIEQKTACERRKSLWHDCSFRRDAVHIAVMEQQCINHILSFDSRFDEFPGITRLS